MSTGSPYANLDQAQWLKKTQELIDAHPLSPKEIVEVCQIAWQDIFNTSIGRNQLKIGKEIFPRPQIIGEFLHELIPAELASRYPSIWRREELKGDKDLVNIQDDRFSIELKTSSNPSQIFGNRSYAQAPTENNKNKDGYFLTVNFEAPKAVTKNPQIVRIGFGWLDHSDWIGQAAATGQQARLGKEVYELKLVRLFPN